MPKENDLKRFFYKGFKKSGCIQRGELQAICVKDAIAQIHRMGLRSSSIRRGNRRFELICYKANMLCEPSEITTQAFCEGCGG